MTKRVYKKKYARKQSRRIRGGNDSKTGYAADVSNDDDTSDTLSPIPQSDEDHQINDADLNFDNEDDNEDMMSLGPQDSTGDTSNEVASLGEGLGAPPADGDGQANDLNMSISSTNNNNSNSLHSTDLNNSNVSSINTTLPTKGEELVNQIPQVEGNISQGGTRRRRRNKSKKTKKSRKSRKNKKSKKSKKPKKSRK